MADAFELLAKIGIDVDTSEGRKQVQNLVAAIGDAVPQVTRQTAALEKALGGSSRQMREIGTSARDAAKGLSAYNQVTKSIVTNQARKDLGFNLTPLSQDEIRSYGNLQTQLGLISQRSRVAALEQRQLGAAQAQATREAERQAAAQSRTAAAMDQSTVSTNSLRYALYDVAFAYGAIGAAAVGASVSAVKIGADFESAFTGVERTANSGTGTIQDLRQELVDLSTQIPLTFENISGIAQLGAQLNIAREDLDGFSQTVGSFSATAGTSLDTTAEGFGRIGQLLKVPAKEYENLGSAILYAGNTSVATEADVLSYSERLAQVAAQYGLSAQSVIGYASTLASVGNGLEASQGAFGRIFGKITEAVAEGGVALDNFAQVSGMTSDEFVTQWQSAPDKAFNALLSTLSGLDNVTRVSILDQLGINDTRDLRTVNNLANQFTFLQGQIAGASGAYADGTYLASSYAKVADDLNSQFIIFTNSIRALIDELTGGATPQIAQFLGELAKGADGLRSFLSTDAGDGIGKFILSLVGAIGILATYRAAVALSTGAVFALQTANAGLAAAGTANGIRGLASAMFGYGIQTRGAVAANTALQGSSIATGAALGTQTAVTNSATAATGRFRAALLAAGRATIIIGLIQLLIEVILNFNSVAAGFLRYLAGIVKGLGGAASAIGNFTQLLSDAAETLPGTFAKNLGGVLQGVTDGLKNFDAASDIINDMADNLDSAATSGENLEQSTPDYSKLADDAGEYAGALGDDSGGVADSAKEAAQEIRTLKDYAQDLGTVIGRAFEIRFSGQQGFDTITSGWQQIQQATEDANKEIRDYYATMQQLTADRAVKEYWLSVAENYGDALRAGQLRADISEIDGKLTDASTGLTKAQDKNSKGLEGNTEGAIANRAAILGLVQNYQGYIQALAASGASQEELDAVTAQLKQQFIAQATQLGFNQAELGKYAAAFDDVAVAIRNVPRDVTIDFNGDAALTALNEFKATVARKVSEIQSGIGSGINIPIGSSSDNSGQVKNLQDSIAAYQAQLDALYAVTGGNSNVNTGRLEQAIRRLKQQLGAFGYASGGMINGAGSGTSDSIVARVSNGEFVQRARAVDYYGAPFMNALNNLQIPRNMFAGGGIVGKTPAPVASSAGMDTGAIVELLSVIASKNTTFGNNLVAQTANEGDARLGGLGNG